ncbi:MAG: azurin, partial [Eikenella corrodens]
MKNLRLLACITALATLCACGQDPKPAEPQAQASAASTTAMPQTASDASNASAPAADEQASAVA